MIGAGLAGLAAGIALTEAGHAVTLYEQGPAAGGRCRSYFDRALGARIDNGNHLLLSGNADAMWFLAKIGATDSMTGPGRALFPFMDLSTGRRWTVEPGPGRVPWWLLRRPIPGTRRVDFLNLWRLRGHGTVAEAVGGTALYRLLLEPLAVSALNTPAATGLARLMWQVMVGSLLKGGRACVPLVPRDGLSESFVDPALAWLSARGGTLRAATRVTGLERDEARVTGIETSEGTVAVAHGEKVVLAVPAWAATGLLPELSAPTATEAIVNVHFRLDAKPGAAGFIGLVGGMAEWIFIKPGIVSVTISAANRLQDVPSEEIAARVWTEICQALELSGAMPPVRVVREKRATFAATAESEAMRPGPSIGLAHFAVAGDWTATGLPATIEGAIRSGRTAARAVLRARTDS